MIRSRSPLHEWRRHHPTARRIAADLLASPGVLNLRTRRLVADIQRRDHVSASTAHVAVSLARKAAA